MHIKYNTFLAYPLHSLVPFIKYCHIFIMLTAAEFKILHIPTFKNKHVINICPMFYPFFATDA